MLEVARVTSLWKYLLDNLVYNTAVTETVYTLHFIPVAVASTMHKNMVVKN